jgi:hypothetical protein
MDINKVQKLSRLATELKKYNIVDSPTEALAQAEKLYGSENNYLTKKKDDNMLDNSNELRTLSMAVKRNEDRTTEIIGKMNELIKEFNMLKSTKVAAPMPPQPNPVVQQAVAEEVKKPISRPIDRNNVSPADISIDKYFYCGKK